MMFFYILFLLNPYWVLSLQKDESTLTRADNKENRDGKLFSLFSIVQFKNEACRSSQTLSNTGRTVSRNGTCYSGTECRDRSGQAAGSCAAGFGVCCVFVYETSGSTITQNCSYIRNPNYPNALTDTSGLQFQIQKCDPSVCYLRLDFESFDINGLSNSVENLDNTMAGMTTTCQDRFTITSAADQNLPTICGKNSGQHVYIDMGTTASDTVSLNFAFTDNTALTNQRFYEIKITQVECTSEYNQFPGCFQYHEGLTGRVETFNYPNCGAQTHLPNQDYQICVRPEAGYDCIRWQICPDQPCGMLLTAGPNIKLPAIVNNEPCIAFSVGDNDKTQVTAAPTSCLGDYIRIAGASTTCCQGSNPQPTSDAFCGFWFNVGRELEVAATDVNVPLCDCIPPYNIDVQFDQYSDLGITVDGPAAPTAPVNEFSSCGFCLIYNQVRC